LNLALDDHVVRGAALGSLPAAKSFNPKYMQVLMDNEIVIIVSGLPRSGTSMLMKMLEAGGIDPLTDRIRTADEDNPKGYYEFERVKKLPDDTEWLEDARGKAVKVLAELVQKLPADYHYKVIFIQRNLEEMVASQKKMLIRRGEDPDRVSDEEIMELFGKYARMITNWLDRQPNMETLYIKYNEILENPAAGARKISEFFEGTLDEEKMVSAIDESLYRNRA